MIRPTFHDLLAEIARGADLVCGYRAQRKDTLVKRLTSRIANFVRSRFTKDGVRDTGCTLKAMRRECVGRARSVQGNASIYSRAGQRRRLSAGRNPGQPSAAALRPEQIWPRQSRRARDHRHVRRPLAALAAIELQNTGRMVLSARNRACQRRRSR